MKPPIRAFIRRAVKAVARRVPAVREVRSRIIRARKTRDYARMSAAATTDPKLVMFESYVGWSYACNPKALYRAMRSDPRFRDHRFVWAFKNVDAYRDHPELAGASLVTYGSLEYYQEHARAGYWISNSVVPTRMKPRADQLYVQTWHGTPIKRLGCDLPIDVGHGAYTAQEKYRWYRAEGERFTYLLTQSPFARERLVSAFGLSAVRRSSVIIEEGYPRNDALAVPDDRTACRIRRELGIGDERRVLLYAPTWRDDQRSDTGYSLAPAIDFARLRRELGDRYAVLFRAHYLVAKEFDFEGLEGFVVDVSGFDDVNELALASDVLVSDYSSLIFDYAVLDRPIIAHMYDLDDYAGRVRGLYLGPDSMPGPVTRTMEDLISAILQTEFDDDAARARRTAFRARFCPLDDGRSSQRVLERVFPGAGEAL